MQILSQELLAQLVSIPSQAPNEAKIVTFLHQYLQQHEYQVEEVAISPNRKNLLVTKGKARHYPLFYGHLDTVAAVSPQSWSNDPYILTQQGNRLFGLGAYDMKGGIATFLSAIEQSPTPVKMLLCVDEEEISEGAWTVIQQRKDFLSDVSVIISAEPNFDLGLNGITIARTGRCLFTVRIQGTAAHIAKFQEGNDAVRLALEPLTQLYQLQDTWFQTYGTVIQVRAVHGESQGMSVMESIDFTIEAIVGVKDSIRDIQERLSTIFNRGVQLKERKTPYLTSYQFTNFPYQKEISSIIKQYTKKNMTLHHRVSVGDDNVLATLGIPVITWGPDGGNAHAVDEYVSLSSLQTLTVMYKELLDRWK